MRISPFPVFVAAISAAISATAAVPERETLMPQGKKGVLVFTLDDGSADHYDTAAPALERHGIVSADPSGRGMGAVRDWFACAGYELHQVL